ncbi:MAG TPA: TonB-dependent receptor [Blastocatellia bacterium]|nr:TonB-dependent receptor [Blastocatellia bacterium]
MKRGLILTLTTLLLMGTLVRSSRSQVTGGTISGTIRNPAGEAIAAAKITAVNSATNQTKIARSDADGGYELPGLSVGDYEISVEADGFTKLTQHLTLRINENARSDFSLDLAGSNESIEVLGSNAPITEAGNSILGAVIENKQIMELPLNGRNFLQLGALVANVTATASLRASAEGGIRNGPFSVSGQRDRSITFLVDGLDNSNTLSDALTSNVSIDAIEEFKMITNLGSAEFGFHSGGQVNIITKTGSNSFHGSAFEFFRDNRLNAPNYLESLAGQPASPFLNNQFGGTLGGPAVKDRAFFFASYEGQRLHVGSPQFAQVPTQAERNGIFTNPATGGTVQFPVDPVAAKIFNLVPLPNTNTKFGNYLASPEIEARDDFGMGRVDYLLSGNDVINVRYFISDSHTLNPIIYNVFSTSATPPGVPGFGTDMDARTHNVAVAFTHNFSVLAINDLRFGYNRSNTITGTQNQTKPSDLGFNGLDGVSGLFGIDLNTETLAGNLYTYPTTESISNFHLTDSFSFIRGHHSIKIGGEARWLRDGFDVGQNGSGFVLFTGLASRISPVADLVLGIPSFALKFNRTFGAPIRDANYGFYAQDDFQVSQRLVLNLGLRYELNTVLSSPTNALTNYSTALGLYTPGVNSSAPLYQPDHKDFAPRVGFAWTATKDGRTVIRGGYGWYYDAIVHFVAPAMNLSYPGPAVSSFSIAPKAPGTLGNVFATQYLSALPGISSPAYDQHIRTPYAQNFNLNIQREFGKNTVVSIGYVGSKGTRITRQVDINQPVYIPGTDAAGNPLSTVANELFRRPTQLFHLTAQPIGAITMLGTSASSMYHSLEATFSQRFSHGLSMLASYTWSKSIDDATDPLGYTGGLGGPQDSNDPAAERGLSIFDMRNRFTVGATYDLPFHGNRWISGWQLNSIIILQSGQPFTPVLGLDQGLTGGSSERPNYVPGAILVNNGQLSFNPSLPVDPVTHIPLALIPAPGHFGTLGRDTFIGPGYRNVDISAKKEFRLNENLRIQGRFEVFNVFNTVNLGLPDRKMSDPLFGISTKTQDVAGGSPGVGGGGPRVMQLAVRLLF